MPRQNPPRRNRVTPFGAFEATPARGTLMGNRGILHDATGVLGPRRFAHHTWIACRLAFRGRRRPVMAPGRYTELFFHDEATALAAGHRPCAECRRTAYRAFQLAWCEGHSLVAAPGAKGMDAALHAARIDRQGRQVTHEAPVAGLPDGAMLVRPGAPDEALLLWRGRLHPWHLEGYGPPRPVMADETVTVLTPAPTLRVLAAGYTPEVALG